MVRPCQIQQLSVVCLIPGVGAGAKTSLVILTTKKLELRSLDFTQSLCTDYSALKFLSKQRIGRGTFAGLTSALVSGQK